MGRIVYSPEHRKFKPGPLYDPNTGVTYDHPDPPERVDAILSRLEDLSWPVIREIGDYNLDRYFSLHDYRMIELFREVDQALATGVLSGNVVPSNITDRNGEPFPPALDGRLGWFCTDLRSPLVVGTWAAACGALSAAISGAELLLGGESPVYALCRPAGNNAGRDFYGGGCYLNNAAAAAARLLRERALSRDKKVAVLEIAYHYGSGTADIFRTSREVLVASIHADPAAIGSLRAGSPDQHRGTRRGGTRRGEARRGEARRGEARRGGRIKNFALPVPTSTEPFLDAVDRVIRLVKSARSAAIVLSFSADIALAESVSGLGVSQEAIEEAGRRIAALGLPTLVVQEGGADLSTIGTTVYRLLCGLSGATSR